MQIALACVFWVKLLIWSTSLVVTKKHLASFLSFSHALHCLKLNYFSWISFASVWVHRLSKGTESIKNVGNKMIFYYKVCEEIIFSQINLSLLVFILVYFVTSIWLFYFNKKNVHIWRRRRRRNKSEIQAKSSTNPLPVHQDLVRGWQLAIGIMSWEIKCELCLSNVQP